MVSVPACVRLRQCSPPAMKTADAVISLATGLAAARHADRLTITLQEAMMEEKEEFMDAMEE